MSLAEDVDIEELVTTKDDLSGADIKAVCSESFSMICELTGSRGWFIGAEGKENAGDQSGKCWIKYGVLLTLVGLRLCQRKGSVQKGREHCSDEAKEDQTSS